MANINRLRVTLFVTIVAASLFIDPLWLPLALFLPIGVLSPSSTHNCSKCLSGFMPATGFDVDITGGADDGDPLPCDLTPLCSRIDGLYSTTTYQNDGTGQPCIAVYGNAATTMLCTLANGLSLQINVYPAQSGSDYLMKCDIILTHPIKGTQTTIYSKNYSTTKPDCEALASEALTFESDSGSAFCDLTALTVTITSVP